MSESDVGIVFKASDNLTRAVTEMRKSTRGLTKDVEGYRKIADDVFNKRAEVQLDAKKAKKELDELSKAVKRNETGSAEAFKKKQKELDVLNEEYRRLGKIIKEVGSAEDRMAKDIEKQKAAEAFKKQRSELELLNQEYERLSQVASEASRAQRGLTDDIIKTSNTSAGRGGLLGDLGGAGGVLASLGKAGLGMMLSNAVQNNLDVAISSAMGSNIGGAISNVIGGAASGAAIGSIIPGIGTAVGAAVGGLTGAINALADKEQRRDDLFRTEVQSLHSTAISETETSLENGSGWAAERENYKRSYASLTDDVAGAKLYQDMMNYGDKTPYDTSVMLAKGMEMMSYGIDRDKVMDFTDMIGNIAMGDANKFSGLSYAVSQSMNSKTLNGQDRRQMMGYGFDPLEFVAKNTGKSMADSIKMMSEGKITSEMLEDALKTATSEGERFHDAVNALSDTYTGLQGQLDSAKKNIEISMGEGYNEARKEGMEKENEAYNGEMGEKMKQAYAMIGKYEGELENQHQQNMISAIENAYNSQEYKDAVARGDGLEAERLLWEAKTDAEIQYKNSEEYQKKLSAERDLIGRIQEELTANGDYLSLGEAMANEFSKGWKSQRLDNAVEDIKVAGGGSFLNGIFAKGYHGTAGGALGFATGLPRVPSDGLYYLHEGEEVKTTVDSNKGAGANIQIAKIADEVVIREEADIYKIAAALADELKTASMVYGGE